MESTNFGNFVANETFIFFLVGMSAPGQASFLIHWERVQQWRREFP